MGFRTGAYATVWEVTPQSNTMTRGRISISRKNKMTEQYEQDFGGFITFVGTAAATKALSLKEKDRIRLEDVDVSTTYNKEKNVTYTNYKVFSFQSPAELEGGTVPQSSGPVQGNGFEGDIDEDLIPF